jgi:hypothetical protein
MATKRQYGQGKYQNVISVMATKRQYGHGKYQKIFPGKHTHIYIYIYIYRFIYRDVHIDSYTYLVTVYEHKFA